MARTGEQEVLPVKGYVLKNQGVDSYIMSPRGSLGRVRQLGPNCFLWEDNRDNEGRETTAAKALARLGFQLTEAGQLITLRVANGATT